MCGIAPNCGRGYVITTNEIKSDIRDVGSTVEFDAFADSSLVTL